MAQREDTIRDYRERINRVIFFVESHLDEELRLEELARIASFSPFHFHRVFRAFTGEPLAGFIRRLRLERATQPLAHGDAPITDIALDAGYESHSAFSRAFAAHFGMTPSEYRERRPAAPTLGARPLAPLSTEEETTMLTPEIRTLAPLPVLFVRRSGPYGEAAGQAFEALCQFAGPRGLLGPGSQMLGVSHDDPHVTEASKLRYDACVSLSRDVAPEGEVARKDIAGGRYAVFLHEGPYEGFQQTYDEIYRAWLPASGERLREEPCVENYLNMPGQVPPAELRTEIWVPIE